MGPGQARDGAQRPAETPCLPVRSLLPLCQDEGKGGPPVLHRGLGSSTALLPAPLSSPLSPASRAPRLGLRAS